MGVNQIRSFRDLHVWQCGMELVVQCYALTARFPTGELFGLTSQARRAATSIPSNLAEGYARSTNVYRYHVRIAMGSQAELDTVLELAVRLGYVAADEVRTTSQLLERVGQMLFRLVTALERKATAESNRHRRVCCTPRRDQAP